MCEEEMMRYDWNGMEWSKVVSHDLDGFGR